MSISAAKIRLLASRPEGEHLDFKEEDYDWAKDGRIAFVKDLLAIANSLTSGQEAFILVGVTDDGEIVGCESPLLNDADYQGKVAPWVNRPPSFTFSVVDVDDMKVGVFAVRPGQRPFFTHKDSRGEKEALHKYAPYYRVGSSNRIADPDQVVGWVDQDRGQSTRLPTLELRWVDDDSGTGSSTKITVPQLTLAAHTAVLTQLEDLVDQAKRELRPFSTERGDFEKRVTEFYAAVEGTSGFLHWYAHSKPHNLLRTRLQVTNSGVGAADSLRLRLHLPQWLSAWACDPADTAGPKPHTNWQGGAMPTGMDLLKLQRSLYDGIPSHLASYHLMDLAQTIRTALPRDDTLTVHDRCIDWTPGKLQPDHDEASTPLFLIASPDAPPGLHELSGTVFYEGLEKKQLVSMEIVVAPMEEDW